MSLADDFVLVKVGSATEVKARADQLSIADAHQFESIVFELNTRTEFGPFVSTAETPVAQLGNRRSLRIMALLSEFEATTDGFKEGFRWLDRPNESLEWISPFDATVDDEAFARAYALVFLTGGPQVEPNTVEEALFNDFCSCLDAFADALNIEGHLLIRTTQALHECTGSFTVSRLLLTCRRVLKSEAVTLFRLMSDCDAALIERLLRTEFGYQGKGLGR